MQTCVFRLHATGIRVAHIVPYAGSSDTRLGRDSSWPKAPSGIHVFQAADGQGGLLRPDRESGVGVSWAYGRFPRALQRCAGRTQRRFRMQTARGSDAWQHSPPVPSVSCVPCSEPARRPPTVQCLGWPAPGRGGSWPRRWPRPPPPREAQVGCGQQCNAGSPCRQRPRGSDRGKGDTPCAGRVRRTPLRWAGAGPSPCPVLRRRPGRARYPRARSGRAGARRWCRAWDP